MNYDVETAVLADYEKLRPIHKEVHEVHVEGRPDRYRAQDNTLDYEYFKGLIEESDAKVLKVEKDDRIIAFCFMKKRETPERNILMPVKSLYIEDFGVDENLRGAGLGKLLFDKTIEFANELEVDSLELGVWEFNEGARGFYEAMGMTTQARKMELRLK